VETAEVTVELMMVELWVEDSTVEEASGIEVTVGKKVVVAIVDVGTDVETSRLKPKRLSTFALMTPVFLTHDTKASLEEIPLKGPVARSWVSKIPSPPVQMKSSEANLYNLVNSSG
jgi:hypothetical protein